MSKSYEKECAIAYATQIIGERWTALILKEIFLGSHGYNDLYKKLDGISPTLLSQRLKDLEKEQILLRKVTEVHPPRVHYQLTKKGFALGKILSALLEWGTQYAQINTTQMTHRGCGGNLTLHYHCERCEAQVEPSSVKVITESSPRSLEVL